MMKKMLALVLALCVLALTGGAMAESVEDQLAQIVMSALDQQEFNYEYDTDNEIIRLSYPLDCALGVVDAAIYLYDDMVSVSVNCPLEFKKDSFEKVAVFTSLANNEMYYAQFRVDRDYGWIFCRSCNVIEGVLPGEEEILTLVYMPLVYMEEYGDGLAAICTLGTDPYEAFEACAAED